MSNSCFSLLLFFFMRQRHWAVHQLTQSPRSKYTGLVPTHELDEAFICVTVDFPYTLWIFGPHLWARGYWGVELKCNARGRGECHIYVFAKYLSKKFQFNVNTSTWCQVLRNGTDKLLQIMSFCADGASGLLTYFNIYGSWLFFLTFYF